MILCGECRVGMWLTAGKPTCPRCGATATVKLAPTVSGQVQAKRPIAHALRERRPAAA